MEKKIEIALVDRMGEIYVVRVGNSEHSISSAMSLHGFKCFEYEGGRRRMTPVFRANGESPTEVAKYVVFEK